MEIRACSFRDYSKYSQYSYLKSLPFPTSFCWEAYVFGHHNVPHNVGFVSYSPARYKLLPRNRNIWHLAEKSQDELIRWTNDNVIQLSRIVIKLDWSGRGLATKLIASTITLPQKRYVEVITANEAIASICRKLGFIVEPYSNIRPDWYYCLLEIHKTAL